MDICIVSFDFCRWFPVLILLAFIAFDATARLLLWQILGVMTRFAHLVFRFGDNEYTWVTMYLINNIGDQSDRDTTRGNRRCHAQWLLWCSLMFPRCGSSSICYQRREMYYPLAYISLSRMVFSIHSICRWCSELNGIVQRQSQRSVSSRAISSIYLMCGWFKPNLFYPLFCPNTYHRRHSTSTDSDSVQICTGLLIDDPSVLSLRFVSMSWPLRLAGFFWCCSLSSHVEQCVLHVNRSAVMTGYSIYVISLIAPFLLSIALKKQMCITMISVLRGNPNLVQKNMFIGWFGRWLTSLILLSGSFSL